MSIHKTYAVFGLGRYGRAVAAELAAAKAYALIRLIQYADGEGEALEQIVEEAIEAIDAAETVEAVEEALAAAMAAIDALESGLPFVDVKKSDFFFEAVKWALEEGITTGTSATTFSPGKTVSRAEAVTFLWRAAGEPEVEAENPFVDVKEGDFFYKAVLWAVEEGITTGMEADRFAPYATANRAQIVTFLWRAAGQVKVEAENPFADVKAGDYFYDAVLWAVENGITDGVDANHFAPGAKCNRAQMVTFLYRAD